VSRLASRIPPERTIVVTSEALAPAVREAVPEIPPGHVIGEPVGKSSAPAIALAARWVSARDPEGVLFVAPADHVVSNDAFLAALDDAGAAAARGAHLLTFGVVPTRPETGYGYIERGALLEGSVYEVSAFHEKPDEETARAFVAAGFLWNSGMFVWRADVITAAIARHLPELHALSLSLRFDAGGGEAPRKSLERYYGEAPNVSIDYGVLEHADNVAVSTAPFAWCDVGSWSTLPEIVPTDGNANVQIGPVLSLDNAGSILFSDGGPIAAVGLRDIVVVRVGEVTMVCPRAQAGRVRELARAAAADPAWRRHV
jgi:mannose-1-phosphate guanylyltransferase